jgi:protein SCO1
LEGAIVKVPGRPEFSLTDHDGTAVTEKSYAGRYVLVFFGFTNCAVVCPRALARLSKVLAQLGTDADRIQPLYVTVDPERDTPDALKSFLARTAPAFTGLTGTQEQIDDARAAFHIFTRRQEDPEAPDGYVMPHTAITYLVGPDSEFVAHFGDSVPAERVTAEIRRILHEESRAHV